MVTGRTTPTSPPEVVAHPWGAQAPSRDDSTPALETVWHGLEGVRRAAGPIAEADLDGRVGRQPEGVILSAVRALPARAQAALNEEVHLSDDRVLRVDRLLVLACFADAVVRTTSESIRAGHSLRLSGVLALRASAHLHLEIDRLAASRPDVDGHVATRHPQRDRWVDHAVATRDRWSVALLDPGIHPLLVGEAIDVDEDLARLHIGHDGELRLPRSRPVGDGERQRDRLMALDRCRDLVLPQADLGVAARFVRALQRPTRLRPDPWALPVTSWLLPILFAGAGMVEGHPLDGWPMTTATGLVLLSYLLLAWATWRDGFSATFLWCLRMPAAAFIGFALVASVGTGISFPGASDLEKAAAALASLGLIAGVVLIEVRGHGDLSLRDPVRRWWTVTAIAVAHAVNVAIVGTRLLHPLLASPEVVDQVERARGWDGTLLLLLTAMLSMAVGLLLQSLWDDEPLTSAFGTVRL